jgi:hypothetical protein
VAKVSDLLEGAIDVVRPPVAKIPADIEERLARGRRRLKELEAQRRQNIEFTGGNHYSWVSEDGSKLTKEGIVPVSSGGSKPDHRVRRSHDLIGPIVQAKVSAATQRIPGYEVDPTGPEPEKYSAARLADKIAYAGYELWHMRPAFQKLCWNALVTEEGFIMPYWDSNIGPFYADPENGEVFGEGDIRIGVWDGLQVGSEPGVEFEHSRFYFIDHLRPKDVVETEPGFMGGKLTADGSEKGAMRNWKDAERQNLVLVTEYLERPSARFPEGRRVWYANNRQIFPEEPYPLRNEKGQVVDEPCIHRLTYTVSDSERGCGLVQRLIESMRGYDYAANKIEEWAQLMLVPQFQAPTGSIKTERDDTPGAIVEYDPMEIEGAQPQPIPVPNIPSEFSQMLERSQSELLTIAASNELPSNVRSTGQANAFYENQQISWQDFLMNLAEVHARVMRDCLGIVQLRYSDERLVKFKGRSGFFPIADFRGADLRGQTSVRVNPGSLEAKTRGSIEQRIVRIAEMFPGYFAPEILLSALNAGNAEGLIEGYEDDVGRMNFIIAQIRAGTFSELPMRPVFPGEEYPMVSEVSGEPMWEVPPRPTLNPETGQVEMAGGVPMLEKEVPGWMPRPFDGIPVQKATLEAFLKSDEWNTLPEDGKQAAMIVYSALLDEERKRAQRDAEMQTAQAEELGNMNAAKPGAAKPLPSRPELPEGEEQPSE